MYRKKYDDDEMNQLTYRSQAPAMSGDPELQHHDIISRRNPDRYFPSVQGIFSRDPERVGTKQSRLPSVKTFYSDQIFRYQNTKNTNTNKTPYWQTNYEREMNWYNARPSDYQKGYELQNRHQNQYFHDLPIDHPEQGITYLNRRDSGTIRMNRNYPVGDIESGWPKETFTDTVRPPTSNIDRWTDENVFNQNIYKQYPLINNAAQQKTGRYVGSKGEIDPGYQFHTVPKPDNIPEYIDWADMNDDSVIPLYYRTDNVGDRILKDLY